MTLGEEVRENTASMGVHVLWVSRKGNGKQQEPMDTMAWGGMGLRSQRLAVNETFLKDSCGPPVTRTPSEESHLSELCRHIRQEE